MCLRSGGVSDIIIIYLNLDCTVSLSTSHLTAPFEVNMKKDSGKDAYLKANADGEKVSITVGGFRDKEEDFSGISDGRS